jgi:DNA-binding beta-propeller fold protein YncE
VDCWHSDTYGGTTVNVNSFGISNTQYDSAIGSTGSLAINVTNSAATTGVLQVEVDYNSAQDFNGATIEAYVYCDASLGNTGAAVFNQSVTAVGGSSPTYPWEAQWTNTTGGQWTKMTVLTSGSGGVVDTHHINHFGVQVPGIAAGATGNIYIDGVVITFPPTATPTYTPTNSNTPTNSSTPTSSPTITNTPTVTNTMTSTNTATITDTAPPTITPLTYNSQWTNNGSSYCGGGPKFLMRTNGVYYDIYDFPVVDASGNIYIIQGQNDQVVKLDSNGNFVTKWGSAGNGAMQFNGPRDGVFDGSGNLYIVDTGNNRVQVFDSNGNHVMVFGSYGTGPGNFNLSTNGTGIAVIGSGSSVTVYVTDFYNYRVQAFDYQGNFLFQWGGIQGTGPSQFESPAGIAVDSTGNVYVADAGYNRIQKFTSTGGYITSVVNTPGFTPGGNMVIDPQGNLYCGGNYNNYVGQYNLSLTYQGTWNLDPNGWMTYVAVDQSSNIYVGDGNSCPLIDGIMKFDKNKNYLNAWNDITMKTPRAIAADSTGNIYVADMGMTVIQKIDPTNNPICQWDGFYGTGGTSVTMTSPEGIAVDGSGNVYVCDTGKNVVDKFNSNGLFLSQISNSFNNPVGVAADNVGNVYVADVYNNQIQKFNSSGGFVTSWGGSGSGNGKFNYPYGVAADSNGHVYVADTFNQIVQKFDASGNFIIQWGGTGSGVGKFSNPYGISVDSSGNIYVADSSNSRIQEFNPDGYFLTKWGSAGAGAGTFNNPMGVVVSPTGDIYVADMGNDLIQKFGP